MATAAVPGTDLGNAGLIGPDGPVPTGEPYDIRFHWDIPEMEAGDVWYGTGVLGSSPATPGNIGSFPVTLRREADDVTKEASTAQAAPGDDVSYEITIQPNVTPEDLVYTIVDTVPAGLTIDPESVTHDGVVDGQTITWEVDVPSPAQAEFSYVPSTPDTNADCAEWGGFVDLGPAIPFAPAQRGHRRRHCVRQHRAVRALRRVVPQPRRRRGRAGDGDGRVRRVAVGAAGDPRHRPRPMA